MKFFLKCIPWIILTVGTIVMIGSYLDIPLITRLSPTWPSMKFPTALSFVFLGLAMICYQKTFVVKNGLEGRLSSMCIFPALGLVLLPLLMLVAIFSPAFDYIFQIFPSEASYDPYTVFPGSPSLVTLVLFMIIGAAHIQVLYNAASAPKIFSWVGAAALLAATVAFCGYLFHLPILFYSYKISAGMAVHTAFLFGLAGIYLRAVANLKN